MKKMICALAVLMCVVCLLTACNFTSSTSGLSTAQSAEKVEEMMSALAGGDAQGALELMHPDASEGKEASLDQMADFLSGRKMTSLMQVGITVNTSTGTGGTTRQEKVSYKAELEDGSTVYLSVTYRTDNARAGFVSFQIVLGVV